MGHSPFKVVVASNGDRPAILSLLEKQFKREVIAILESVLVWNMVPIVWNCEWRRFRPSASAPLAQACVFACADLYS
jgi:hypothetical protein